MKHTTTNSAKLEWIESWITPGVCLLARSEVCNRGLPGKLATRLMSPSEDCPISDAKSVLGEIDREKLNVNGGAIALGHPVGATGTRLVLTLLHQLSRRKQNIGLTSLADKVAH